MGSDRDAETSVPVHELIRTRWSPRSLDPNGQVGDASLRAVLEAARWAPSNGNTQPARFMVGRRGEETHERILALLSRRNREWAWPSAALVLACMATRNEKGLVPMAEYGVGLAVQNLVLQAVAEGLVAHQMGGFDREGAKLSLALPEDIEPLVVIALGTLGSPDLLDDARRERELAPRRRKPLAELAFTGEWGNPAF